MLSAAGSAPSDGYLVFDDLSYPGWVATVDGRPAPIHRVDYLLQGVRLHPGRHQVRLVYAPLSFLCGMLITLATVAGLAAYLLTWLLRGRRPRKSPRNAPARGENQRRGRAAHA